MTFHLLCLFQQVVHSFSLCCVSRENVQSRRHHPSLCSSAWQPVRPALWCACLFSRLCRGHFFFFFSCSAIYTSSWGGIFRVLRFFLCIEVWLLWLEAGGAEISLFVLPSDCSFAGPRQNCKGALCFQVNPCNFFPSLTVSTKYSRALRSILGTVFSTTASWKISFARGDLKVGCASPLGLGGGPLVLM